MKGNGGSTNEFVSDAKEGARPANASAYSIASDSRLVIFQLVPTHGRPGEGDAMRASGETVPSWPGIRAPRCVSTTV